jgi:adenylosuccinate lyase
MQNHLDSAGDTVFSGGVLLALVEKGASRHQAYEWVQRAALGGAGVRERLKADEDVTRLLSPADIDGLFSLERQLQHVDVIFARVLGT